MTTDPKQLKDNILSEIRSGSVSMRPKLYFSLQLLALILLVLGVLAVTVLIFNFILFSVRLNREDVLLGFGPRGWGAFLQFFPWTLLSLDIVLVVALEALIRHFRFGYRVPALYLFGGILLLTVGAAAFIDRGTPVNDDLWQRRHDLPPAVRVIYIGARQHDIDDTLRGFGIPLPSDVDDESATSVRPMPTGTVFIYKRAAP